jgi:hypothetical protein
MCEDNINMGLGDIRISLTSIGPVAGTCNMIMNLWVPKNIVTFLSS